MTQDTEGPNQLICEVKGKEAALENQSTLTALNNCMASSQSCEKIQQRGGTKLQHPLCGSREI